MLLLIERLTLSDALRPHVADLIAISRSVSRQLGAWIESLKNSHDRGPRFRNDSTRQAVQDRKRRDAFLSELERIKALPKDTPIQEEERMADDQ